MLSDLLKVASFTLSAAGNIDLAKMSFTINERGFSTYSEFCSPAFIVAKGGSDWSYDKANSVFVGTVGGVNCTMEIRVSGHTEGWLIADVIEGLPAIAFKATHDIGIWITLKVR